MIGGLSVARRGLVAVGQVGASCWWSRGVEKSQSCGVVECVLRPPLLSDLSWVEHWTGWWWWWWWLLLLLRLLPTSRLSFISSCLLAVRDGVVLALALAFFGFLWLWLLSRTTLCVPPHVHAHPGSVTLWHWPGSSISGLISKVR